jgi:hypothetical protein
VRLAIPHDGLLVLRTQVVVREHREVRLQRLLGEVFAREAHAQGRHFAGAEVIAAAGAAQLVLRYLLGLQAQHRQRIEVGASAEHLARLAPGAIEQDEERALRDRAFR